MSRRMSTTTPAAPVAAALPFRVAIAAMIQQGQHDIQQARDGVSPWSSLALGEFNNLGMRGMVLKRALLGLGQTGQVLTGVAAALTGRLATGAKPAAAAAAWRAFVLDYFYWRGAQQVCDPYQWRCLTDGPRILMYHAVGHAGEAASRYVIPAHVFESHMAWLRRKRYDVISLDLLLDCRRESKLPPPRAVVITFDDGYRDNAQLALPILQRYGFSATIFLVSQYLGQTNGWDVGGLLKDRPLMSVDQALEVRAGGMALGAHSRSHRPLTSLSESVLADEVRGCKTDLETLLKAPVPAFAYPHGRINAEAQVAVMRAGFLGACGSEPGVNDPGSCQWALRRLEVRGTVNLTGFALMLTGGKNRVWSRLLRSE